MRAARDKQMVYVKTMNTFQKVPHEESLKVTWKPPIRLRSVDTDKSGGIGGPSVRRRLSFEGVQPRWNISQQRLASSGGSQTSSFIFMSSNGEILFNMIGSH